MEQYVHLLSSSPISLPTDLWVPVTKNIRPMRSYQYAVGGYYTGVKGWEFSLESYYKDMHNVLEYQDGATFFGSSGGWQEKVEMGRGRSFGLEVLARRPLGKQRDGWDIRSPRAIVSLRTGRSTTANVFLINTIAATTSTSVLTILSARKRI